MSILAHFDRTSTIRHMKSGPYGAYSLLSESVRATQASCATNRLWTPMSTDDAVEAFDNSVEQSIICQITDFDAMSTIA